MLTRSILRRARLPVFSNHSRIAALLQSRSHTTLPPDANLGKAEHQDTEGAGRTLAKLSKIAQVLRERINKEAREELNAPELLVSLEQEVDEAMTIIKKALDGAGCPCTPEELGDHIDRNIICIPTQALGYKEFLRASQLRDEIERTLISLQVMPPKDTMLDGAGKPFCKLDRKRLRDEKALEEARKIAIAEGFVTGNIEEAEEEQEREQVLTELRPVSDEELAKREAHMRDATKMENVLKGYDTALLEVGRVNKVTKGGTTMSMRALVIIGNRKGTAGYGEGKSDNAQHAIERACRDAKRNLMYIDRLDDRTIHHRVRGKYVKSKVTLWPSPRGAGISANNNFTAVFRLFGLKDVGAKLHGPRCMANSVKSLFNALSQIRTAEEVRQARGLSELIIPTMPPVKKGYQRRKIPHL